MASADAVSRITAWSDGLGLTDRVEVLGFVDVQASVDWTRAVGGRVINLLTKGSLKHCREQLRRTPQQHLDDIRRTIDYGVGHGIVFNVYLEDWSNGMRDSPEYVQNHVAALAGMPVQRLMLCEHARHPQPGRGADVRRPDHVGVSVLPLRLPRPQRLRAGHGQYAGGGAGRRAGRPLHGQRHGGNGPATPRSTRSW